MCKGYIQGEGLQEAFTRVPPEVSMSAAKQVPWVGISELLGAYLSLAACRESQGPLGGPARTGGSLPVFISAGGQIPGPHQPGG